MTEPSSAGPRDIACFFTLASPWAYLGHAAFVAIAARHGARVTYRPMPVGRVFDETGGLPLPRRHPVRQRYRLVELQRWRERRGVPLVLKPRQMPFDVTLADRCAVALAAGGQDPEAFIRSASAAIWAEERDLGEPAVLLAVLGEAGVQDPDAVLERAAGPDAVERHEANYADALAAGVFGAPSYVLDGEVFWGQDRLELLDAALTSGRRPYRPEG